jgi:hypothetical protein
VNTSGVRSCGWAASSPLAWAPQSVQSGDVGVRNRFAPLFFFGDFPPAARPAASHREETAELREQLALVQAADDAQISVILERGNFSSRAEVEDIVYKGSVSYSPEWALENGLIHGIRELDMTRAAEATPTAPITRRSPLVDCLLGHGKRS